MTSSFVGLASVHGFLNPSLYTSLGDFDSDNIGGANTITVKTQSSASDPVMEGVDCTGAFTAVPGNYCTGVRLTSSGGSCVSDADCFAVFTFNSFNLGSGDTIDFGSPSGLPLVILSKGGMTLSGTINANGGDSGSTSPGIGGPGGGEGGYESTGAEGSGAGGAGTSTTGAGGGGFGGAGGDGGSNAFSGGVNYNDNTFTSSILQGGSGGGASDSGSSGGAGGGGAVEFGALGTLLCDACVLNTNGGAAVSFSISDTGMGGGSGGGILLHAKTVTFSNSPSLGASGGVGGDADPSSEGGAPAGGGGGGGRIYVAHHPSGGSNLIGGATNQSCIGAMNASIDVTGGAGGTGMVNGSNGDPGTCYLGSDSGVPIPEPRTYAMILGMVAIVFAVFRRR